MERRGVAWRPPPGIQRTKNVEGRSYWTVSPPVANRISFNHCQIRRGGARSAPRKKRGVTGDAFAKQPETLPIPLSEPVDDRDDSIWQRVFLERTVQGFPFPVPFSRFSPFNWNGDTGFEQRGGVLLRFVDTVSIFILFGGKFVRWNGILTIVFFSLFLFENWFFWIETI